jgi:hypothetical protein
MLCLFYCLFFLLRLLTTPLVSSDVLSILLSVLLRITASDHPFGFIRRFVYSIVFPSYYVFWLPLRSHQTFFLFYCLSFFLLRLLTTPLVSSDVLSILLSVLLRMTSSDYHFGFIRRFVYSIVCPSYYGFWLPLWFHQMFCLFYCLSFFVYIFWLPLWSHQTLCLFYCLFFLLRLLTTPLVSSDVLSILLSVLLRMTKTRE